MDSSLKTDYDSSLLTGLDSPYFSLSPLSLVNEKVKEFVDQLKPLVVTSHQAQIDSLQSRIAFVKKFFDDSKKVAYQGLRILKPDNSTDEIRDPLPIIIQSHARIASHHQQFADFCLLLSDQFEIVFFKNIDKIKVHVRQLIDNYSEEHIEETDIYDYHLHPALFIKLICVDLAEDAIDKLIEMHQDLIVQTIKANFLHLIANLSDRGFDSQYVFADSKSNSLGRLLSLVGNILEDYIRQFDSIQTIPVDKQEKHLDILFQKLSTDLLELFFPLEANDIQLFHPYLPGIPVLKDQIWNWIQKNFPLFLKKIYEDFEPLSNQQSDWEQQFEERVGSLSIDDFKQLPSQFITHFVRNKRGEIINELESPLIKLLKDQGVTKAEQLSKSLVKYTKELFLTHEPILIQMGKHIENDIMERLLFNLSQFDQNEENISLLISIAQKWIEGNAVHLLEAPLVKEKLNKENVQEAIHELLEPLGFNQKETFPLPSTLKQLMWPMINHFQETTLPLIISDELSKWQKVNHKTYNQQKINFLLDDDSLSDSVSTIIQQIADRGFEQFLEEPFSLAQKLQAFFSLTDEQIEKIDNQWQELLQQELIVTQLYPLGYQYIEMLIFQLLKDLFFTYHQQTIQIDLNYLFNDVKIDDPFSFDCEFAKWFIKGITEGCQTLFIDQLSVQEKDDLKEAIILYENLRKQLVPLDVDQKKLNKLWTTLEPKFVYLLNHLLNLIDYQQEDDLPVPAHFQKILWSNLRHHGSLLLFKQMGNVLLIFLEKEELKQHLTLIPAGGLIEDSCEQVAKNLVEQLPNWLDEKIDELPKDLTQKFNVNLADHIQHSLISNLKGFLYIQDPTFEPCWRFIEKYIENLLLKSCVKLSQADQFSKDRIKDVLLNFQQDLSSLNDLEYHQEINQEELEEQDRVFSHSEIEMITQLKMVDIAEQVLMTLGIEAENDLFGIPPCLQKPLLDQIKIKMIQAFIGIHQVNRWFSHRSVTLYCDEEQSRVNHISQAIFSTTCYAIDKKIAKMTQYTLDGQIQVVQDLQDWSMQYTKEKGPLFVLFEKMLNEQTVTSYLENHLTLLDMPEAHVYQEKLIKWLNPFLTEQVVKILFPILNREQEEGIEFDQLLFLQILPILKNHLKYINQASSKPDGLNFENYQEVAGDELHSATCTEENQIQFYRDQIDLLFNFLFPQGELLLAEIVPEFDLKDETLSFIWNKIKDELAQQLPHLIQGLFEEQGIKEILKDALEELLQNLNQPINRDETGLETEHTEEEKKLQTEIEELLGEVGVEVARFADLPVDALMHLPNWLKKISGLNHIQKVIYQALGKALKKQLNGEFVLRHLELLLSKLMDKKYIKATNSLHEEEMDLQNLEKSLARYLAVYPLQLAKSIVDQTTHRPSRTTLSKFRKILFRLSSVIFFRVFGSILKFLRLDRLLIHYIYHFINKMRKKLMATFVNPEIHENFLYHALEKIEVL